jgi:hypothetical protein
LLVLLAVACPLASGCGRDETQVATEWVYIEAEDGQLMGGFTVMNDPRASGGKYIQTTALASVDAGSGVVATLATYNFNLTRAGNYRIWGRVRDPDASHDRWRVTVDDANVDDASVQLFVEGGTIDGGVTNPFSWRLSTGVAWWWRPITDDIDYLHPVTFPLSAGSHEISFTSDESGLSLDRLWVVPADVPHALRANDPVPANTSPCRPPDSIELTDGGCKPSCGSFATSDMMTTCPAVSCNGFPERQAYDCNVCCLVPLGPDAADLDGGTDEGSPDGGVEGGDESIEAGDSAAAGD